MEQLKACSKVFDVSIDTEYTKNIIAKDSTGVATEYKIIIEVVFKVDSQNLKEDFKFKESFNMQSIDDKLDEQDYEENIQSNLVNTITRKFNLKDLPENQLDQFVLSTNNLEPESELHED